MPARPPRDVDPPSAMEARSCSSTCCSSPSDSSCGWAEESCWGGASRLALLARVTPTVIGLTVVAAGTSAPERVVSVSAAIGGRANLAMGNVAGSNIFKIGLILGLAALLRPLQIRGNTVRLEWPVMALSALQRNLLPPDGTIDALEGACLSVAPAVFMAWSVRIARRDMIPSEARQYDEELAPPALGVCGVRRWLSRPPLRGSVCWWAAPGYWSPARWTWPAWSGCPSASSGGAWWPWAPALPSCSPASSRRPEDLPISPSPTSLDRTSSTC